jgi:hypothetical protein
VLLRIHLRRPAPAIALAAGLLLAGCGDDEGAEVPQTESAQDTGTELEADPTDGADEDDAAEGDVGDGQDAEPADDGDEPEAQPASGDGDGDGPFSVRTGSVDLEELVEFDTGVQVAVTGITVEAMAIFVDVQVRNGWSEDFTLAGWSEPRLTDNADRQYPYVTPEENQDLLVPAGGSLEATLAFRGAANPNATRVELLMNRNSSNDSHHEALFRDLPLPGES